MSNQVRITFDASGIHEATLYADDLVQAHLNVRVRQKCYY